ncbi:actin-like atpase domain-containing protein [Lichtheimia corymbifera JMRC:FSU:9682]|uniref:Actin-like atpase domain-containing protein n=1 Tax=Lichtheimia corymbifera JMRC:FSU:9682 TaxID=1263082 RepID=A0A068S9B3_9FUNG|nr:actin-like atpase domain-containing protein [Lichtheimia corymbifera JMRC:FSU:9682]
MAYESRPFDPSDYSYVIGIDFGTTFSGCCYSFTRDNSEEIFDIIRWPRQTNPYPKTPTVALYPHGSSKMTAWGQEARKMAARRGNDILLSRFKLHLDENLDLPPLPNGLTALDTISDYLEAFHAHICNELQRSFASNYDQSKFRYCLTVPAMWSDQAKATMREAAIRSGIINRYDHPDRLMLISEPEAAALYCEKKCDQFNLGHGQRFMICDAGGGTVDLIVFEIDDSGSRRALKEVTKGQGDSCGSTFLDAQMREYLKDRFYGLGRVSDTAMDSMMENFIEGIKPQFEGDEDQFLLLPATLGLANMDDPANGIEDGNLRITAEDLCEHVFEPVVRKVLTLIDEQLRQSPVALDAIFLVGGFGQSEYLRRRVIDEFANRVGFIGVPPRGELAVVRGAVYFGLNPQMVTERVSRRSYGVETRMVFDPRLDPQENCIAGDGGRMFCKQRFSVYVHKGQRVKVDECVSKNFMIAYPNDTDTDLFAYDGDGTIPRLTTHPQVFKVARFPIKMPKFAGVQKGEPIFMTIKMFFGMTEIKIEVHIRDRVFTFTSAFETLERGLGGVMNGMNNLDIHDKDLPAVQPRDSLFSSNSNLSSGNQTSPQPSLRNHDPYSYSSPASRYPRSFGGEDDGDSIYDGESKHSGKHGTARRLLGFKFGKRKDK